MIQKTKNKHHIIMSISIQNPNKHTSNKTNETVSVLKPKDTAMRLNEKAAAYWDNLKVSKWCKEYSYNKR